jgi:hypothetical protein
VFCANRLVTPAAPIQSRAKSFAGRGLRPSPPVRVFRPRQLVGWLLMPKNRRPRPQRPASHKAVPGPVLFKHPFSDISHEKLVAALSELGQTSKARFPETLQRVVDLVRQAEPLQTISMLAVYALFSGLTSGGKSKPIHSDPRFGQPDVELVQAISLRSLHPGATATPPDPSTIQALFDTLPDLSESFSFQRLANDDERFPTAQSRDVAILQEHLRMHTQRVRNWSFLDCVIRIVNDLYGPLDPVFEAHLGAPATGLISLFNFLLRRIETLVNDRWEVMRRVLTAKTVVDLARRYFECDPASMSSPQEFVAFAERTGMSLDGCKALIFADFDVTLPTLFTFTPESIADAAGLPLEHIRLWLSRFAVRFGELAQHDPAFFLLDNPVWLRPVIALDDGRFFCALPQVLFSFILPIFDRLIAENVGLQRACEKRRAQFLEAEIARLFVKAFSGTEVMTGFKWREGPDEYQNDFLIRVDSHLLIVEAKSGTVSASALRGSPERAKRHFKDLIYDPSRQSSRLAERIRQVIKAPESRDAVLPGLNVRLDLVRTVLRLSVTLEDFAVLQTNSYILKRTGWIPEDHALAPCILLADLEVIFDVLETCGQRLHYLRRRAELAEHMNYVGDELDLLGLYLGTGFNVGELEFEGQRLMLTGMSHDIDEFCSARAEGRSRRKPSLRLSRWWTDICAALEQRAFHQWTDVGNILMSFSFNEQRKSEKMFSRIKHNVMRHWREPNHLCSVSIIPHVRRSDALSLYAFRESQSSSRRERMTNIAARVFDNNPHVERCLILGVNIDRDGHRDRQPYETLAIFFRGEPYDHGNGDDLVVY